MVVVGSQCTIFEDTGKTCTVNSFSESTGQIDNINIVDAVAAYDCPFRSRAYLLIMRNFLHALELSLNLLSPFIMCEAGIIVDECPKSQSNLSSIENHQMLCLNANLRIHFNLNNIFSSFHTKKPANTELETCVNICITLDSVFWDPYSENFHNK